MIMLLLVFTRTMLTISNTTQSQEWDGAMVNYQIAPPESFDFLNQKNALRKNGVIIC